MAFEIKGGSGNTVILIRCDFFPKVPSPIFLRCL